MAAQSTYTPIYSVTMATTTASVVYSSIPATYTDICVSAYVRGTNASTTTDLLYRANSDVSNSYDGYYMRANRSTVTAARYTYSASNYAGPLGLMVCASATASIFSAHQINFMSYANTNFYKQVMSQTTTDYDSSGTLDFVYNQYFNTAAINTITLFPAVGSFAAGSVVTFYGIKSA